MKRYKTKTAGLVRNKNQNYRKYEKNLKKPDKKEMPWEKNLKILKWKDHH